MPFDGVQTRSLSYQEANDLIGGLSTPSKMPWFGWSISAKLCNTGAKLRKKAGTVCSKCYAMKGFYMMPVVKNALDRRVKALDDPDFAVAFIVVLKTLFAKSKKTRKIGRRVVAENRFRWHDSGDLQNEQHLDSIVSIALGCPEIEFYLPSKEYALVKAWLAKHGAFPKNLHVKLSYPTIGGKFENLPDGVSFSTAGRDDDTTLFQCPALKKQGNKCLDCHMCWTEAPINYPVH